MDVVFRQLDRDTAWADRADRKQPLYRRSSDQDLRGWSYDKGDFMAPWRVAAPSGQIDLTFTPLLERVAASDLWLVRSEVHQTFGHYEGTITTADGLTIAVGHLLGWAEDHIAKW